tara:strand:+ start:313 stop:1158 length:846 start_codon:yes stop_codon:yes gene_type:complete
MGFNILAKTPIMKHKFLNIRFVLIFSISLFIVSCSSDSDDPDNGDDGGGDITLANKKPLGSSANDFLSDAMFSDLRLEIAYVDGYRPAQTTIDNLLQFLAQRLNKSNVSLKETIVPATNVGTLDIDEVVEIENTNRTVFNAGDELAVWVFFADQSSEKDEGNSVVLGTAYRNTSCIIYEKTIEDINNSVLNSNKTVIESTTLQHEFGHLFGLVNGGTDMVEDHEDVTDDDNDENDNARHCVTDGCLMYYQTVSNVFSMADLNSIPPFDSFCLADLRANGGK